MYVGRIQGDHCTYVVLFFWSSSSQLVFGFDLYWSHTSETETSPFTSALCPLSSVPRRRHGRFQEAAETRTHWHMRYHTTSRGFCFCIWTESGCGQETESGGETGVCSAAHSLSPLTSIENMPKTFLSFCTGIVHLSIMSIVLFFLPAYFIFFALELFLLSCFWTFCQWRAC